MGIKVQHFKKKIFKRVQLPDFQSRKILFNIEISVRILHQTVTHLLKKVI
jgi:hypothetical protein